MKILFLGLLYDRKKEEEYLSRSKCGLQAAPNSYQWNLIDGLEKGIGHPVDILHSLPVGSYPTNYKKLLLSGKNWSHTNGAKDEEMGCINLPVIKQIMRYYIVRNRIKKWSKINAGEALVVMSYSMYLPFLKALSDSLKIYKHIHSCIIVPDLPNAFGFGNGFSIRTVLKKINGYYRYRYTRGGKSFVLLTEYMVTPLNIKEKFYTVVEGISPINSPKEQLDDYGDYKILLYTGAINKRFGMDKLLEAFHKIENNNLRLWICGMGDYKEEIEKASREDSRITYFGYKSAEEVHKMQMQATILVNPRANEEEYTKYSFPSKTLEYMTCAKPVLMYKLDGIPDDYDEYLIYIRENTVESIKDAILHVSEMSIEELTSYGDQARTFAIQNKNAATQGQKVLDMLHKAIEQEHEPANNLMEKQKTILQVNITCGYGSTGRIVEELHYSILNNGMRSYIAYSAFSSKIKTSFRIENKLENYLRRGMNRIFGRKYIHSAPGTLRLIHKLKKLKPDLIHLHNIQQNSIHFPMLMKFLKNYDIPIVYTLHDCWAFTGGCYHFTSLGCNGYQSGCNEAICPLKKEDFDLCNQSTSQVYFEKKQALSSLKYLKIICVSNWLMESAKKSYMKVLPLEVIYNGIDINQFRPVSSKKREQYHIQGDDFVILGIANNWDEKKGLATFLELSKSLECPYRIIMIGLNPMDGYDNILSIERTDQVQELVEWYSCADVLFNASKEETFGLVSAEAMACGTPVIAYDSTACGEVVRKECGILLKTECFDELLNALENIRKKGKRYYCNSCRNNIISRFSKENFLNNYMDTYLQMIKEDEKRSK